MNKSRYTLYGFDISYFTGKMHAYLRYKQVPHEFIEPRWWDMVNTIYPNTGLMKVPAVRTPDGTWLQDTTPMIDWFEERYREHPVLPADPGLAFLCRLVEDYADEWLWRPALHFRWNYPVDATSNALRFTYEFLADVPLPRRIKIMMVRHRQMKHYVRGDGVNRRTVDHVEDIYLRNLDWLQAIFEQRPFLLGARPCLADFGYFASMFRHFSLDPTPARIMRDRAPAVYEWVSRMWNVRAASTAAELPAGSAVPRDWKPILEDIGSAYLPYLHANAIAWQENRKRFDAEVQGVHYRRLPASQYRAWCRERLQQQYAALPARARQRVTRVLDSAGCSEPLLRDGTLPSHLLADDHPGHPAERARRPVGLRERATLYFTGTHWRVPGDTLDPQVR